jgi:metal-sulfur cluster biosynthetic enzyme
MEEERFEYTGPDELRETVHKALSNVVDPEVALDIVSIGLVYAVHLEDDHAIVRMTMTSAACPVADMIAQEVEAELEVALPHVQRVDVDVVWEPPWTPDRMSTGARRVMGW